MARIAGVDLPREKRAEIGLTYIYGIGRATANEILAKAEINPDVRIKDLSDDEDYGNYGFQKQEFEGEELVDVEEEDNDDDLLSVDEDTLEE